MLNRIEKELSEKGIFVCRTQGDSMEPMICQGRDRVVIIKPEFPLKKYDVPVYRRGDHLTMHRIVCVKNGRYIICGDNRVNLEKDITDKDIVGVLAAFYQGDEYIECTDERFLKYAKKAVRSYPVRVLKHLPLYVVRKFKRLMKRIFGRMGK